MGGVLPNSALVDGPAGHTFVTVPTIRVAPAIPVATQSSSSRRRDVAEGLSTSAFLGAAAAASAAALMLGRSGTLHRSNQAKASRSSLVAARPSLVGNNQKSSSLNVVEEAKGNLVGASRPSSLIDAATRSSPVVVAAASTKTTETEEKPSNIKKVLNKQKRIRRLFEREFDESVFTIAALYQAPHSFITSCGRIWDYWQTRPTRIIEKMGDGDPDCGCTWKQVDGRRGVSFFRFNPEDKIYFIREIAEPIALTKFRENNMRKMKWGLNILEGMASVIANLDGSKDKRDTEEFADQAPKKGLQEPLSMKASDVVSFLWEEALVDKDGQALEKVLSIFSDDCVIEDLSYTDDLFCKGKDEARKYWEDTIGFAPKDLRWEAETISQGVKACTVVWHYEFHGQIAPRGVSFYEVNDEGKICYLRSSYDLLAF